MILLILNHVHFRGTDRKTFRKSVCFQVGFASIFKNIFGLCSFWQGLFTYFPGYRIRVKRKKKSLRKRWSPFMAFLFHISFIPPNSALCLKAPPIYEILLQTHRQSLVATWDRLELFQLRRQPRSCALPRSPDPFPPLISGTSRAPCPFTSLNNHSVVLFAADFSSGLWKT